MNKRIGTCCATAVFVLSVMPATGQDLYVYPSNGQSDEQLADDRYECHRWAVDETGFDPSLFDEIAPPRTIRVPVPKNETQGATGKGAIAGAVAGGVIGAHDGDVAEGAVIGAVVGTIIGAVIEDQGKSEARAQAEEDARQEAEELQRSKAELSLRRSNYRRALTACLDGRGYTVK